MIYIKEVLKNQVQNKKNNKIKTLTVAILCKLFAHYRHLQITEKWQPHTNILRLV
jgi:hypothetical protein